MEKGFEFNIDEDFHLYIVDKDFSISSQEFAYRRYIKKHEQVLAELKIGNKSVRLLLKKNYESPFRISKYYVYSESEFNNCSEQYKQNLIEEMCNILGTQPRNGHSYNQYKELGTKFLYSFYIEANGQMYKNIKQIKNIRTLDEDTFFQEMIIENEAELLSIMQPLI